MINITIHDAKIHVIHLRSISQSKDKSLERTFVGVGSCGYSKSFGDPSWC